MPAKPLLNDQNLIIQRYNQGIKLGDADRLHSVKKQIALNDILNLPFHVYFVNRKSEVKLLNTVSLNSFNILSMKDTLGLTAWDVSTKKAAAQAIYHDGIVLHSKRLLIKDELYESLDGISWPMLSFKYPWYDTANQLIGIFGCSIALCKDSGMSLATSMNLLIQTGLLQSETMQNILPGVTCGDNYFTEREKIILLQLMRGKTARAIATLMGRSQRTIESHIENLKAKTNSLTKSELIEKMIDQLF